MLSQVPELPEQLAEQLVRTVGALRGMELKKVAVDRRDHRLGAAPCSRSASTPSTTRRSRATLGVVLKHQSDQERASGELRLN